MKWRGWGTSPVESKGTQGLSVWMPFIIRNKNIYGLGVVTWTVCKILDILTLSSYKCLCYQIWPWPKIGQGHPRVIIWTNYDGLKSPTLHTKFRGNRPSGSREKDWRVFTLYGHSGHLGHVTRGLGHWMCLIIRNKNIYSVGVGILTVSALLHILWSKGGGAYPGGPPGYHWSVPLNASCHKDQEYIWFRGGNLNGLQVDWLHSPVTKYFSHNPVW